MFFIILTTTPMAAIASSQPNAGLERLTLWLVVATSLLVVVTAIYAWHTRQMVGAMRRTQDPKLVHVLKPFNAKVDKQVRVLIRVVNTGFGPAYNIDTIISTEPPRLQWPCEATVMMPNEVREFSFPPDAESEGQPRYRLDKIAEQTHRLSFKGTYEDAFGKKHSVNALLDVRETHERWKQFGPPESTVGDQPMADIAAQLETLVENRPLY